MFAAFLYYGCTADTKHKYVVFYIRVEHILDVSVFCKVRLLRLLASPLFVVNLNSAKYVKKSLLCHVLCIVV